MNKYYYDKDNNFVIEDYHRAKTFSSFLPGIAGELGIPVWSFYVNRGQGISSFGIQNKDKSIMEFFPANSSYQYVSTYGFRTFIKDILNKDVYEPFKVGFGTDTKGDQPRTKMTIMKDSFTIEDYNKEKGISVKVTYSTLSNVPFGGLIRSVELKNISSEVKELEVVDGMPMILPYGVEHDAYKKMSNLMRSWMEVSHTDTSIPYYKLRSSTKDEAQVSISDDGYFYINDSLNDSDVSVIYDPSLVFDYQTDLQEPIGFITNDFETLIKKEQVFANKVPSAFQLLKCSLKPGESKTINSLIGYVSDYKNIANYMDKINLSKFVKEQMQETKKEVDNICSDIETKTGNQAYDEYIKQTYLDNVLRGGKPLIFNGLDKDHVYHIYSRKHGDPERDYNFFSIEPTNYSQGNGNYRDVCQNRRNDVVMDPQVKNFNIWMFYNLVQADGYNPLSIKGTKFVVEVDKISSLKSELEVIGLSEKLIHCLIESVEKEFTPGTIMTKIGQCLGINLDNNSKEILEICLKYAKQHIDVDFGEGFWSDHFTYNQDLIESYEYIYPDQIEEVLFNEYNYQFYNAPYYVVSRDEKYNLMEQDTIRQYESIAKKDIYKDSWLKGENGESLQTNLFNKMLVLSLTKFMNLDPFAMGLEMEGDKPGWNDALNGLPGLLGSGMSESIEIKRCIDYLIDKCKSNSLKVNVSILEDIYALALDVNTIIENVDIGNLHSNIKASFKLWDDLNNIKETYREKTKNFMTAKHLEVELDFVQNLLEQCSIILDLGIEKATKIGKGIIPSYFINEVTEFELNNKKTHFGKDSVKPLAFNHRPLPYFLEGPTRLLKTQTPEEGIEIYKKVKSSDIYDEGLQMYKTSASLNDEGHEIGRIRAFTPGWLERESVFLHMTYKYLLSTLEAGLYDEFYEDMKTNFIPMLDPKVYGRSTTENSSFLASSINPDPSVVGQGFVARLSGSTAEAISMWIKMFIGNKGFEYKNNNLSFTFEPKLASNFFNEEGHVEFRLFDTTKVLYVNKTDKNTYGENAAIIDQIYVDGDLIDGDYLSDVFALRLRTKKVKDIKIVFK